MGSEINPNLDSSPSLGQILAQMNKKKLSVEANNVFSVHLSFHHSFYFTHWLLMYENLHANPMKKYILFTATASAMLLFFSILKLF